MMINGNKHTAKTEDDDGFSRRKPAHEYPRHINDAFFHGSGA